MKNEHPAGTRASQSAADSAKNPQGGPFLPAHLWWSGLRPRTLPLAVVPVIVGGALACHDQGAVDRTLLLVTLLSAACIQAGTNLFNDAKDGLRGDDGPERTGPERLTASGKATGKQVLRSAWLFFALALLGGVCLVLRGGIPILLLGLGSLAAGWAYSGGPRPLSHTPWGEGFVIAFFGVAAVGGTYYLQTANLSPAAMLLGLALGAQAAAMLIVNNHRDYAADLRAGRHTLAAVLGPGGAAGAYAVLMLLPYVLSAFALSGIGAGIMGMGAYWAALPFSAWLAWRFPRLQGGAAMNRQLGLTALAQLLLGALLALTLLVPVH